MNARAAFSDRAHAALLGLAMGDAYGRPLEFLGLPRVREVAVPLDSLRWTDDTHMSLYLSKALLDLPSWDAERFGMALSKRWLEWLHDPLTPSTAPGNTCLNAVRALERGVPWQKAGIPTSDGCGAVMRIAPLPIALDGPALTQAARLSALSTHAHPNAVEAAVAACWLMRWTLEEGVFSAEMVQRAIQNLRGEWSAEGDVARSLEDALMQVEKPGLEWLEETAVHPGDGGWRSGSALGLAVAAALRWGDTFSVAVDKAARIAGDSDSVACLTGMFLGAAHGRGFLPAAWRQVLFRREELERTADQLVAWGEGIAAPMSEGPQREVPAPNAEPARTSLSHPIEVAWVSTGLPGKLGITFAPGKCSESLYGSPWDRNLGADLDRLAGLHGVDLLVPLIEDFELVDLKIPTLVEEAERRKIVVHRLPIPDGGTPSLEGARRTVACMLGFARAGRTAVVHCRGGLGRAGTLASCCLVALGKTPHEAMAVVREARPGAVENPAQERFVEMFGGR